MYTGAALPWIYLSNAFSKHKTLYLSSMVTDHMREAHNMQSHEFLLASFNEAAPHRLQDTLYGLDIL